jgi:histidine ammonia-lyase
MAALGAVRLGKMVQNLNVIRGVAAIYAAQGIDFRAPLRTSVPLQAVVARLRQDIETMGDDRYLAPDLVAAAQLVNAAGIAMPAL